MQGGLIEATKVDLPHNVKKLPYHYYAEESYQGVYTYENIFDDAHPELPAKILTFEGAMLQIEVYLNGEYLGHYVSGYMPVHLDVTGKVKRKDNVLVVYLDSREDPEIPPFGNQVDYLCFGGLYRGVYLDHRPLSHIKSVFVSTDHKGNLTVETEIANPSEDTQAKHTLLQGGVEIASFKGRAYKLQNVHPYSLEDPYLYTLVSTYGNDEVRTKVGFRTVKWEKDGFYLNGKKTKLLGLNRHQTYPYFGAAAPASLQREDAHILKSSGINVVRTSHYADGESFLDECDALGLLVLDEIPGWQHIGQSKKWRETCYDFTRRLILKERNHPSLIAYGLRIDESGDDHELYSEIAKIAKTLDPTRSSIGVRNQKDTELIEDVYAYNDFSCGDIHHGLDDPKTYTSVKDAPRLVTENNGHMFPCKSYDVTSRRVEHALRHARVIDDAFKYEDLCGMLSWCAFDYPTHKEFGSADRICYHGVYDIFRLPKYASYVYRSQGEEPVFEVASLMQVGDYDRCVMNPVYVFTNADYLDLYKNEKKIGRFKPDREEYPYMSHPPIKVDDFVGELLVEEKLSKKLRADLLKALNAIGCYGIVETPSWAKRTLVKVALKLGLDFKGMWDRFGPLIAYGSRDIQWTLIGYKDGKQIGKRTLGPSTSFSYQCRQVSTVLLNGPTYDASVIYIRKIDQNGTILPYADDDLVITTEGPIALMGPSNVHLVGGGIAIYVRSLSVKGPTEAKLKVKGVEELCFNFTVDNLKTE